MVCPVCVTSAIVANAPMLAAGLAGGVAALKLSVARRDSGPALVCRKNLEAVQRAHGLDGGSDDGFRATGARKPIPLVQPSSSALPVLGLVGWDEDDLA